MIGTTVNFSSSLGHEELTNMLTDLENVFVAKINDVEKVEIVQHSNSAFDVTFYGKEKLTLDHQSINMALFDVGLTGFLI